MSVAAGKAEVSRDKARGWMESSLAQGFELSGAVLASSPFDQGRFYVLAPEGFKLNQRDFSVGGVISAGAADAALAQYLEDRSGDAFCIVVEDDVAGRTDPAARLKTKSRSFLGDRVIHWCDIGPDSGAPGAETIRRGAFGYPLNAFLTSESAARLGLVDGETVGAEVPSRIASSLQAVVVAAFDAESFLIWDA